MASSITSHTHNDLASPATSPLLNFLKHFADKKEDEPYLKVIHQRNRALWTIGDGLRRDVTDNDAQPDESVQDEEAFMNIIDGPGIPKTSSKATVTVVGAGISGLVAAYELKRAGFKVRILEASSRVGGRIITRRDPEFAPGLHAEGGAMRIPGNHFLLRAYIKKFNIDSYLPFEMANKFVYLSGYDGGTTLTQAEFDSKLRSQEPELLKLFPNLHAKEKGKTVDELFLEATKPVVDLFQRWYGLPGDQATRVRMAYQAVTMEYDKYTLRSYLTEVAGWSTDALNLFDLGNAHVVFENGFIESWKDAFLSSNDSGGKAGMEQLQNGMDQVPKAFISPDRGELSLADDITYGAHVTEIIDLPPVGPTPQIQINYRTPTGREQPVITDYLILAVPYTAQRAIAKSRAFAPGIEQAIRDVRYIEITKVLLQYSKRWWEDEFTRKGQGTDGGVISDLPIRYTMFPVTKDNHQMENTQRGAIMAAYVFQQDATILAAMTPERRIRIAAENLDTIFPHANSLNYLEAGASQAFPCDELAGGSAFTYFGPGQKTQYLETMRLPDWEYPAGSNNHRVFFAGEHASFTHGWIHGAMEAGLRCAQQLYTSVTSIPSKEPDPEKEEPEPEEPQYWGSEFSPDFHFK